MKFQHAMFLTVVAAGTLISASDSNFPLVGAASLLLAITERTARALIPLTAIGVVVLSSTPASATCITYNENDCVCVFDDDGSADWPGFF
ncbi:hypothetical protein HYPSUDRAFT_87198 [Hypholoma sublateritium FD-334 SS-4]|uniref:Uncharacterized protein n=1 Tax=Hypholoma sublateritium (strain FD-334 SS-4) TaxID=945553 RepID=A0A0D2NVJ1_HYPSF|nr:hypothetical protein HYPSUDRAFT_87198 [Hypholoma sublateritium FD-334 SS-4]